MMAKKLTPCAKAAKAYKAYKKAAKTCKASKPRKKPVKQLRAPASLPPKRIVSGLPLKRFDGWRVGDSYFTHHDDARRHAAAAARKTRKNVFVWRVSGKHEWDDDVCSAAGKCTNTSQFR